MHALQGHLCAGLDVDDDVDDDEGDETVSGAEDEDEDEVGAIPAGGAQEFKELFVVEGPPPPPPPPPSSTTFFLGDLRPSSSCC